MNPGEPLVIYGAGGHGLVVAEAARAAGWRVVGFVDEQAKEGQQCGGLPVEPAPRPPWREAAAIVAIGDNAVRQRLAGELERDGRRLANVIHPLAWLSPSATLGRGVYLGPLAAVNARAEVADGVIINTAAVVEHDCRIGAFAHIGPRAALCGGVAVGARTLIGVGAAVRPQVRIGADCTVGAGAAVVRHLGDGLTAVGVPARPRR